MSADDAGFEAYVNGLIGAVLNRLSVPFMMLDHRAQIIFINPLADAILQDGRHLARHSDGQLVCNSPISDGVIRDFLTAMPGAGEEDVDILIHGRPGEAPLFASLTTFRPPSFRSFAAAAPVAVVFIRAGYEDEGIEVARILYALSDAETNAVRAVVSGTSLKQHADARKVSVHTARKQLNSAMKKAGVSSQLQLQTLIGELMRAPG